MFHVSAEPAQLSEAGLQAYCPALNAPVVHAAGLPVGPARAAIALHANEYGGLLLTVVCRAVEGGDLLCYGYQGPLDNLSSPAQALDIGRSFAEGMGFLFDDDWVADLGRGRGRALDHWRELTSDELGPEASLLEGDELEPGLLELADEAPSLTGIDLDPDLGPELGKPARRRTDDELLLDDIMIEDMDPPPARAPGERGADPLGEVLASESLPLTKFRGRPPAEAAEEPKPGASARQPGRESGGNTLGRISLVRRRVGAEGSEGPSPLIRLLSHF